MPVFFAPLLTHIGGRLRRRSLVFQLPVAALSFFELFCMLRLRKMPSSSFWIRSKFLVFADPLMIFCFQDMNFRPTSFRFSQ
jgi:hypothetical protein